jgi:hypothetical protein
MTDNWLVNPKWLGNFPAASGCFIEAARLIFPVTFLPLSNHAPAEKRTFTC